MNQQSARPSSAPERAGLLKIMALSSPTDLRGCQELQRRAFGISEDGYLVPVATMIAAAKAGGLVLGAYLGSELVGFSFAFLGRIAEVPVLFSQVTAVDPLRQRHGIGRALKIEQRRRAQAMGLPAIVWTFDPLRTGNAHFNLVILGATSRTYEVDLYGARTDALSAGLASDRLLAEWSTVELPGLAEERWTDGVELVEFAPSHNGAPHIPLRTRDVPAAAPRLTVEIPADIDVLKLDDPALARSWQLIVRAALRTAFAEGFVVVGFADGQRPKYMLERRT